METKEIKNIIEAIIFAAGEPISINEISRAIDLPLNETKKLVLELRDEYDYDLRGIQIKQMNSKVQIATRPEYFNYIQKILQVHSQTGLSQAGLETLAIIAYKQPVTRIDIEMIRGVRSASSIQTLIDRGLIKDVGRLDSPGKPILYGTTNDFLRYIGITSIKNLPKFEEFSEGIQEKIIEKA